LHRELKKRCSHKGPKLGNSDLSNQKCELDQKTNIIFLLDTAVVKKTDVLKFEITTWDKTANKLCGQGYYPVKIASGNSFFQMTVFH